MILADNFASSPAQWLLTVTGVLTVALIGWIARTLMKQNVVLDRLTRAIFPENRPTMPEQIEAIRDDARDLRLRGSDRLTQIVEEARLSRIEAATNAARVIAETRNVANTVRENVRADGESSGASPP